MAGISTRRGLFAGKLLLAAGFVLGLVAGMVLLAVISSVRRCLVAAGSRLVLTGVVAVRPTLTSATGRWLAAARSVPAVNKTGRAMASAAARAMAPMTEAVQRRGRR